MKPSSFQDQEQPEKESSCVSHHKAESNLEHDEKRSKRKRLKRVLACIPYHQAKLKCNQGRPCQRCSSKGMECIQQTRAPHTVYNARERTTAAREAPLGKARQSQDTYTSYYSFGNDIIGIVPIYLPDFLAPHYLDDGGIFESTSWFNENIYSGGFAVQE
ncbi:hypothetical protein L873DRAFT_1845440, partial [Choiromyces venosus 120613-1]